jgi:micrococcal nuclease
MMRFLLFILIYGILSSTQVLAQASNDSSSHNFKNLKRTGTGTVDTILDGLTLILKDGRVIRLSDLDIPGFVYPQPSEISLEAKAFLAKKFPKGTDILIYQTKTPKIGRVNRMDQLLAHITTKDGNVWAQEELVKSGLARVAPTPETPEMIPQLYKIESSARKATLGLWQEDAFPTLTEDTAGEAIGQYAIIRGTIDKTASVKNNVYLNFGSDWRKDFTVMIAPKVRKDMVRAGMDPLSLSGKTVEARGWVREYNGPLIELNDPLSIRVLPGKAEQSLKPPAEEPKLDE